MLDRYGVRDSDQRLGLGVGVSLGAIGGSGFRKQAQAAGRGRGGDFGFYFAFCVGQYFHRGGGSGFRDRFGLQNPGYQFRIGRSDDVD